MHGKLLFAEILIISGCIWPTDAASSTQNLYEFATKTGNSNILAKMATLLDQKSSVKQYWPHLGHQFKLSGERIKQLEYGQYNQVIMAYVYSAKPGLTIGTFYDEMKKLKRRDVLRKLDPFIVGELVNGCLC